MIGRSGDRRATSTKPAAAKVEAKPALVALGETPPSSGYARQPAHRPSEPDPPQRSWTAEDGTARSTVEVVAEELGPSLRWTTATTTRATRSEIQ